MRRPHANNFLKSLAKAFRPWKDKPSCVAIRGRAPSLTFLACIVMAPDPANAAALTISPISVEIPSASRAVAITIANSDKEPVSLQARIFSWSQVANEERLDPANDLIVSPPTVTVPAGSSYTIRIARASAGRVDGERTYRLIVDELPRPADPRTASGGIRMVLRNSIPVFVVDPDGIARLKWTVWQDASGLHVRATNSGTRHARISDLTVIPEKGEPIVFGNGLNGYVLPGATKQFDLTPANGRKMPSVPPGSSLRVTASDNDLEIGASVTAGSD